MTVDSVRLAKAIEKAFHAFPFGFDKVETKGEWAFAPSFICRLTEDQAVINVLSQYEASRTTPMWYTHGQSVIDGAKDCDTPVHVDKDGHPMKQYEEKDSHGATQLKGSTKCTGRALYTSKGPFAELSFPLFSLARAAGATTLRMGQIGSPIYGWDAQGRLVVVLAPRLLDQRCEPVTTHPTKRVK